MIKLNENVFFVLGRVNGAIYDLNANDVFAINQKGCRILDKALNRRVLSVREQKFMSELIENNLFDENKINFSVKIPFNNSSSFDTVWLEITQACNMRCIHCYEGCNHKQSVNDRLTLSMWKNVIEQIKCIGVKNVVVIGGEPTLDTYLLDILSYLHINQISTTLFTNLSFDNVELLDKIKDFKIEVKFSLYGHSAKVHDFITQQKGSFDKLKKNIAWLVANNVNIIASVILMKENEKFRRKIEEFLKSMRVSKYSFDVIRDVCGGNQAIHAPILQETISMGRLETPNFSVSFARFYEFYKKNTCWNKKIVVTENGNLLPCVFARDEIIGNVKNISFANLLKSEKLMYYWNFSYDNVAECSECEYRYVCKDCRPLAMAAGGISVKNPRCGYKPLTGEWTMKILEYEFTKICDYSDCFKKSGKRNDFSILRDNLTVKGKSGVYFFLSEDGKVIYVGEAHERKLFDRITQHFRDTDTGGLRYKHASRTKELEILEKSSIYVLGVDNLEEIKKIEEKLIDKLKPKLNKRLY